MAKMNWSKSRLQKLEFKRQVEWEERQAEEEQRESRCSTKAVHSIRNREAAGSNPATGTR